MHADTGQSAKERLFWAALTVFAAKGYKGATVRDICQEAGGANLNAVQYYFGGKDNLYQAVLEMLFTEGDRQMRERLAAFDDQRPESRLRLLIEVFCQSLFGYGKASERFLQLWVMELANPTPFLGDMIERHTRPQTLAVLELLASIVGRDAPLEVLLTCLSAVLGPAVYQAMNWSTLRRTLPEHRPMADYWPQFAAHLYRFSMAGLAAVRESLEGGADA